RLCGTGFRFPTITAALKEFDQFALRAGVDLLVRWFHSRRPPCRTSRQDYRRSCLPTPRRCCPRCQLHAPEQKSTRSARRIAPSSQQFSSPQLEALMQWTGAKWAAAKEQETEAERAWQAQAYKRAAERYEQACQRYTEARGEAEEARLRQHALEANQQAEQGRTAAKRAEAQLYAPELYQRAKEA